MDIQTKDGIILRNIPEGTPEEAIKARLATLRSGQQPQDQQTPEANIVDKVAGSKPVRFAIGAADPIIGLSQLTSKILSPISEYAGASPFQPAKLKQLDQSIERGRVASEPKTLSSLVTGEKPDPGFDFTRLAGNVMSPVNALLGRAIPVPLSTGGRTVTGATVGGAGGATMPVTEDGNFAERKAAQIGVGTLTGGILSPLLGKVVDAVAPRINSIVDRFTGKSAQSSAMAAQQADEAIFKALEEVGARIEDIPRQQIQQIRNQATQALTVGKKLDAAALLRKGDFDELHIPGTLGQITRDPTQFATERNLRAADPRLTTRFNEQSRALAERLKAYGGSTADEPQVAGQKLAQHLAAIDKRAGSEVSAAYKVARDAAGRDLDVPLQGLAQDISLVQRDYGSKVPDAVLSRLGEFGVIKGGNQTKVFTINDAEDILQQTNKLRGNDPAVNNALEAINKAIKKAVLSADDQGGVFAKPRELAAQRFKVHELVPAIKAAADGDASADKFVGQFLLRGETSEVKNLAKVLKETSPEMYQQARSQFGQEIMRSAYGENTAGDKALRPEALAKVLRQFGSERLKAFFNEGEIAQMQRIARVGSYIESIPAASPVNTSNTYTAGVPQLLQMVPGGEKLALILRAGAAAGRGVANERAVGNALKAEVPSTAIPSELSPEMRALLSKALLMSGAGAGMATASGVQ